MERNFTINDIISIFLKRLWLIVILALLGGTIAYSYSQYVIPKKYTAKVTMYVSNPTERQVTAGDISFAQKLVDTYLVILKSNVVLNTVSNKINGVTSKPYTAGQIRGMLRAASVSGTEVFEVAVSCDVPEDSKLIADTISAIAPDEIIRVVKAGNVEVIDTADTPKDPSSPNVPQNTIIGIIIGIGLACGLAFLMELMNTSIKSKEDLSETFKYPVLTLIPDLSGVGEKKTYKYYKYEYSYESVPDNSGGKDETA